MRFPAAAPIFLQAARQHAAESPKLSLLRAARRQPAIFILGSWQTSNALALQASLCGSVTHRLHQFQLRETRPMHREKPHKLLQVGVTPTPATIFPGKRSGCPTVNRVSENKVGSDELERYQRFPPFGLVAQLAERPVVCGRVEGATPFGSAIFSECSSVFRASGLGPGGRRWKSCHSDQIQVAAVVEYMRHPSSKRNDAGGNPVGSAIAR